MAVELLEGNVEGWENSGFQFGLGHKVVLGIIELEVDNLVDV
jgi:hypothetical protein